MINNSPIKPNRKKGVIPAFANVGAVDKYVGLGNYNRSLGNFSEYGLKGDFTSFNLPNAFSTSLNPLLSEIRTPPSQVG